MDCSRVGLEKIIIACNVIDRVCLVEIARHFWPLILLLLLQRWGEGLVCPQVCAVYCEG